jgi:hypothetical protein
MGIIGRIIHELDSGVEKGNAADLVSFLCGPNSKFSKRIHKKGLIPGLCKLCLSNDSENLKKALDALHALTLNVVECGELILADNGENEFKKLKSSKNKKASEFANIVIDKILVFQKKIEGIKGKCHRAGCENRGDFKKCGNCKAVCYCGTECQKIDWKRHKIECDEYKDSTPKDKKKTEIDRTVSQKWITEHMISILIEISKRGLTFDNCIVELDMIPSTPQLKIWSIEEFESQKEDPYALITENTSDYYTRKKKNRTGNQFILLTVFDDQFLLSIIDNQAPLEAVAPFSFLEMFKNANF